MKKAMQSEAGKIWRNPALVSALLAGLLLKTAEFGTLLFQFWQSNTAHVWAAPDYAFPFNNWYSVFGALFLILYVPLALSFACNDIFQTEMQNKMAAILFTRQRFEKVVAGRAILYGIFSVFLVGVPQLYFISLCYIAFPAQALTTSSSWATYIAKYSYDLIMNPDFFARSPFVYLLAFAGMCVLFGWIMGLVSLAVTLYGTRNRFVALLCPFVFGVFYTLLAQLTLPAASFLHYASPGYIDLDIKNGVLLYAGAMALLAAIISLLAKRRKALLL